MNFIVDAQLPARLARSLAAAGHDAVHTTVLVNGNRSTDTEIAEIADSEDRVVVTKDRDFRDSHLLRSTPLRLLIVSIGNTSNETLITLFNDNIGSIVDALNEVSFVELRADHLVVHEDGGQDEP